jgi:uncharacterized protein
VPEWSFDSSIFLYATGGDHPYRDSCRELVAALGDRRVLGHVNAELLQELAHVRGRRSPRGDAAAFARAAASATTVHACERADALRALDLYEAHPELDMRDAVHAATALRTGVTTIVATDRAFDVVAGLTRLDPIDAARQL